jgi:hypothetical protein
MEGDFSVHDVVAQRKRTRVDDEEHAMMSYPRRTPPHARVRVVWGEFSSLLSLRGHVLDAHGHFNTAEFPSLALFYSPTVVSVESGTVVLQFADSSAVHGYVTHYTTHHPCPVHGPFRCPCRIMHEMADSVTQLLREIFCQHIPFDVTIDGERNHPFLCIRSESQTWSTSLVGLPLPPRTFGPFPLGGIASPQSIKRNWSQYSLKNKVVEDACVMCGVTTATQCSSCACRLCGGCAGTCHLCGSMVCHGCSAADEHGTTVCYRCAR